MSFLRLQTAGWKRQKTKGPAVSEPFVLGCPALFQLETIDRQLQEPTGCRETDTPAVASREGFPIE